MPTSHVVNVHEISAQFRCAVCGAALAGEVAVRLGPCCLSPCDSCKSWTYLPRATAEGQAAVHDNAEYYQHPYFQLRRVITPAHRRRCRNLFARFTASAGMPSVRGERLLDIGCDTGTFLKVTQEEFGIVPVGVDVSERAVREARKLGIEAYHCLLETAPAELAGFGLATAIDLIEHVPSPGAFLREVVRRLRPGGLLYLETPNIRSAVYRFGRCLSLLTGGRPAGLISRLFPPQHIQYFTPESLRFLAHDAGFDVLDLHTRVLPSQDIAASLAALAAISALQTADRLLGTEILICAVLRRPF